MLLSDIWIKQACQGDKPLISPFVPESTSVILRRDATGAMHHDHVTSFGLSSYGYDLQLGNKFKLLLQPDQVAGKRYINPNDFDQGLFRDHTVEPGGVMVIPPRGFVLGHVTALLNMPDDVMGVCMEKSTIARAGMEVCVTPVEAGWSGYLTLEIHNKTDFDLHLTPGMGITQLMFYKGEQPCSVPYHARNGKYQNQLAEPVAPRTKKTWSDEEALETLKVVTAARTSANAKDVYEQAHRDLEPYLGGKRIEGDAAVGHYNNKYPIPVNQPAPVLRCPCARDCTCQQGIDPTACATDRAEEGLRIAQGLKDELDRQDYTSSVPIIVAAMVEIYLKNEVDPTALVNIDGDQTTSVFYYDGANPEHLVELATRAMPEYTHITCAEFMRRKAVIEQANNTTPEVAFLALRNAFDKDEEYAWSWYCNLAMPVCDSLPSEITMRDRRHIANYAGFVLMLHLFKYDVTKTSIAGPNNPPTLQCDLKDTFAAYARSFTPAPVTAEPRPADNLPIDAFRANPIVVRPLLMSQPANGEDVDYASLVNTFDSVHVTDSVTGRSAIFTNKLVPGRLYALLTAAVTADYLRNCYAKVPEAAMATDGYAKDVLKQLASIVLQQEIDLPTNVSKELVDSFIVMMDNELKSMGFTVKPSTETTDQQ